MTVCGVNLKRGGKCEQPAGECWLHRGAEGDAAGAAFVRLAARERSFVEAYCSGPTRGKGAAAARAAGYTANNASSGVIACRLLRLPNIRAAVGERDASLLRPVSERVGRLFIVKAAGFGLYRVGHTFRGVRSTVAALRPGSPLALELFGEWAAPESALEDLRRVLRPMLSHGSWYRVKPEEAAGLRALVVSLTATAPQPAHAAAGDNVAGVDAASRVTQKARDEVTK